jgi:four helix bundle protein
MGAIRGYRDLLVWQKGVDLVVEVYQATKAFPRQEQFGLTAQIRRSAGSIPANVAEGHTRAHSKEYRNFISVAQGSLAELETHLIIAQRLGYLTSEAAEPLFERAAELGRMMNGLDRSLASRLS